MQTTCFDPRTEGVTCVGGDYTVGFLQPKLVHYNFNEISLFCGTVLLAKL